MTESILVSNLLYKNHRKAMERFPDLMIGGTGPVGVNISAYRKTSGGAGSKISAVARVFERILDGYIKAICGKDVVYTEFVSKDGKGYSAVCDGKTIDFLYDRPERNWEAFIPLFLYETRPGCENKELYNAVTAPVITNDNIYLMCDSFYYGCAMRKSVNVSTHEIALSTIEAGLRSGLFGVKHPLCESIGGYGGDSSFGKEEEPTPAEKKKEDDPFEAVCAGQYAIAYEWDERQKSRIPSLSRLDGFVPTATFWKTSRKIKYRTDKILMRMDMGLTGLEALGKDVVNFFMTGKPGTGKTTIAEALAAAFQLPFYSIPIQKGTEEGTFQGLLKARDGKFEFSSTDFLDAFKNGGIIMLEELNLADPAILSGAIGQAIEAPYMVMEDELRPVYRHPLCIIVGAFNVGTAGSKEINPMLSSRFYQTYLVDDPTENEFVERLMKFDCDRRTAKKVYNAYDKIIEYLKSDDVSALEYCKNVTFRGCVGAIQCIQEGSTVKEAIEDTLIGKIAEYDLELARDVMNSVVDNLPD